MDRIATACARSGRNPNEVTIVGVTKGHSKEILSKARALKLTDLGENKVQEAIEKYSDMRVGAIDYSVRLHMIGHLQSNKAKRAVELFDSIDTIDQPDTAQIVDKLANEAGKRLRVLMQVNTSGEPQKSGIEPDRAVELGSCLLNLKNLDFQGFMTIGPLEGDERAVRKSFEDLRKVRDRVSQELKIQTLPVLSMGMSDDFEWAIEEGATEIRLGTILWGPREL
ncbi:MAG: YggS family pyridoxal phosphate-dependent enzyme [bacterium]|nr:YggS family pyridoxal phosphate-dependent enzyme [bacterium]